MTGHRLRSRLGRIAVVVVAGVCAAGCGGIAFGDDGDETTVAVPPAVVDVSVVGQTLTPPARQTVVIPEAWPSEIEALYGRYWLYWDAFAAAFGPPHADPEHGPLRTLSTDRNWASLSQQLEGFRSDGLVLVLPDRSITEHLIRLPNAAVVDGTEGAEVVLQDCWIDDFVQQTEDGAVVAEAREAKLMNVTMKVENGTWRVDGVTRAATDSDGHDQCEALLTP
ncbi:MAG: hypothetical protein AAF547_20810 [Actinomycetota bacterium]